MSNPRLEVVKGELNWVELWRVWWKILYIDAGSLAESSELLLPVNSYIYILTQFSSLPYSYKLMYYL
jgi:hypothetical protein